MKGRRSISREMRAVSREMRALGFDKLPDRAGAIDSQMSGGAGDSSFRTPGFRSRRGIPPKLYRVGEIVDYSGVSRQTVHNYTIMGLIRESDWTRGGHRLYDEGVFERLDTIAYFRSQRKSLDFIRKYFVHQDTDKDA